MDDKSKKLPRSVTEVVDRLISELTLKDKTAIVDMEYDELVNLNASYGAYIRSAFGLWSGNEELMESCRFVSGEKNLNADGASFVIIENLWKKLLQTHTLRVVK
ncbi:MAG: hypothetical protein KKE59_02300 [Proteobacteria bacterium]|uniref:DUF6794 domain-containing protein n=1 Tax=Candidatus Desulfatibia profunda TaxID=2841695 RepID=A0A8J6TN28_9BACT|nr:hypothetical protein [Candidatus Desulfatibia profunda]MBU0698249.1 hypothetical protein [Pseudomonadota bacterium]